ncbi:hypothetical protein HWV62_38867 [Athelia sp. TMB]|nr:hypothetical protein HWV62_38867 [Athelia sp. TMB]
MAPSRLLLAAVLIAVHSFAPALAADDATTITASPLARRTPGAVAKRATSAHVTTYETISPLPLTEYHYPYSAIPEQVNPYAIGRGPQAGYNICNSTTEGATSECQTMVVNTLADFCLWGSPKANGVIGDVEAAVVAYCTQPGHGTRIIPAGSITAAQLGNPIGGLVYSTGLPSGDNSTYLQSTSWNNFVGSGTFCIKVCDPTVTKPNYCQNIYDLIGCNYNMPAAYTPNEFTSCEGELQDEVGTYTSGGATFTWDQPSVLPPTSTLPWQPRIPASSNCVTYSSEQLFGGPSSSSSSSASATVTSTTAGGSSSTASSSTASATATGAVSNGAGKVVASSGMLAVLGAAFLLL